MPAAPTSSPRVRRKRDARIKTILDAAMAINHDAGVAGLTMRRLATALDITPGALYRYFASKEQIIAALGHGTLVAYAEALRLGEQSARVHAAALPAQVRDLFLLLATGEQYRRLSIEAPGQYRVLNIMLVEPRQYVSDPADYDRFMASLFGLIGRVASLFDVAVGSGALKPGDSFERALSMWAILNGSLQLTKVAQMQPDRVSTARIQWNLLRATAAGWGANPAHFRETVDLLKTWSPPTLADLD